MIKNFRGIKPNIDPDTFIAENVSLIGNVSIGKGSSIWFNAVLRGDIEKITVGMYSNIQDNAVLHTSKNIPTKLGDYTVVGHNAIIHGCTIGNNCLIGMGSIVLDEVIIGDNCIIGAGTVITAKTIIPSNSVVIGVPGRIIRETTSKDINLIRNNAKRYNQLYKEYK